MNPEEEDVLMNRFLSKQRPSLSDASQGSLRHSMESVLSPMDTGVRVDFRLADIGPREQERGRSYLDAPVSRGDYEMAHVNLPRPSQSSRPPPRDEPSHYFPRSSLQQKPGEDVLVHSEYTPIENIQPSPLLASRSQPPRPISTRNVESIELDFLSQINNMPNMEPSSMNQVLGAVKKQSDTIRKLQQAITDLEAARQQTPSSPPKWADLKRTLASQIKLRRGRGFEV
ncbi:hypothetical protein BC829DRAFT_62711 [Chytridium lagenaria]|nr:hypothetical protein BC829DRAFT_62711 [Chytridium lagenaria]